MLKTKSDGFSLMEVLISMIVIAVGLLGYLSLQLSSINSNQEGMARSQATLIAQDLASSLRSNRSYIFNGDSTEAEGAKGNAYLSSGTTNYNSCSANPAKTCANGVSCTDKEQAQFDVWMICRTVTGFDTATTTSDLLNDGRVFVGCDDRDTTDADTCSPGSTLTIYAYWLANANREDTGQKSEIIRNSRCDSANFASDPGANYDCIVMDIMP